MKSFSGLYLCFGGGLGHLTRACSFLSECGYRDSTLVVTQERPIPAYLKHVLHIHSLPANLSDDTAKLCHCLAEVCKGSGADTLFLDSFPYGMFGEWLQPPLASLLKDLRTVYLARILRYAVYERILSQPPIPIDVTLVLEDLYPEHHAAVRSFSKRTERLALYRQPGLQWEDASSWPGPERSNAPYALVLHSGSSAEVAFLIDLAQDYLKAHTLQLPLTVLSQVGAFRNDVSFVQDYPAERWITHAERIFCAGGFNCTHQLQHLSSKVMQVPFPRRFDDQHFRLAQLRKRFNIEKLREVS